MLRTTTKSLGDRARLGVLILGITACLTLVVNPAAAEEHDQEVHTVVERPVVVVRSGSDHPGFTWTVEGHRSFLGVQTLDLTPELREHFGVPPEAGVLVAKIVEDSPASESDLRVGDILSAVDGADITSPSELARAIGQHDSGEVIDLEVWREGTVHQVQSTLVERQGPWVDIRQIHVPEGRISQWEFGDTDLEGAIELETETLNKAIERLNKEMDSPEWKERVHTFHEHQGSLMKRIELLETRLRELEAELEELSPDE